MSFLSDSTEASGYASFVPCILEIKEQVRGPMRLTVWDPAERGGLGRNSGEAVGSCLALEDEEWWELPRLEDLHEPTGQTPGMPCITLPDNPGVLLWLHSPPGF